MIPLNILQDRIRSAAEEVDELSAMLQGIDNAEVNIGEVIDCIDGDEKLVANEGWDGLDDDNSSDDNEVLEIDTPIMIKHENAIRSCNVLLQWAEENGVLLSDIMTLQKFKGTAFGKTNATFIKLK